MSTKIQNYALWPEKALLGIYSTNILGYAHIDIYKKGILKNIVDIIYYAVIKCVLNLYMARCKDSQG